MYVGKFIDGVVGSTVHDELQPPTSDTSVRAFMCSGAVLRGVRGRVGDRVIVLKLQASRASRHFVHAFQSRPVLEHVVPKSSTSLPVNCRAAPSLAAVHGIRN